MFNIINIIKKTPNYFRAFGLLRGFYLLIKLENGINSDIINSIFVPWLNKTINIRNIISDKSIFWQCIVQKQYDLDLFPQTKRLNEIYKTLCKNNISPLIIDCGGNIGLSVIHFNFLFPNADIVVLEPDKDNYEMLKKNIININEKVKPILGGIWNEQCFLEIDNPTAGSAAFQVKQKMTGNQNGINGYTINDILSQSENTDIFIVKIDIEGAQKQLFEKNTEWLNKVHLLIIEIDDDKFPWEGTSQPFFKCISNYPFEYLIKGENLFCFRDFSK